MNRLDPRVLRRLPAMLALGSLLALTGCRAVDLYNSSLLPPVPAEMEPPRERSMVSLPTYRIGPSDLLQIEVQTLVPRPSYRLAAFDVIQVRVVGVLPDFPIDGFFLIEDDGLVVLGPNYGVVQIMGLTVEQAAAQIRKALPARFSNPYVSVQLTRSASIEDLTGVYSVQPDGVVVLQNYGAVHLAGKTVTEARRAVEAHLAQYFDSPRVGVNVSTFNSEGYYVIVAGTNAAAVIQRFPMTGNETVLDALARLDISGTKIASQTLWLARPARGGMEQVLPIDWDGIARGAQTATNYQILPGDRLYIVNDTAVAVNDVLTNITAPVQHLLGFGSLGTSTVLSMEMLGRAYNQSRPTE